MAQFKRFYPSELGMLGGGIFAINLDTIKFVTIKCVSVTRHNRYELYIYLFRIAKCSIFEELSIRSLIGPV